MSKSRDRRRRWERREAKGMNDPIVRAFHGLSLAARRASRALYCFPAYHYGVTSDGRTIPGPVTAAELEEPTP